MSRVLIKLKQIEPTVTDFESVYKHKCDLLIEAIRMAGEFDSLEETGNQKKKQTTLFVYLLLELRTRSISW